MPMKLQEGGRQGKLGANLRATAVTIQRHGLSPGLQLMTEPADPLHELLEALRLTPENLPLRQHVAEQLLRSARYGEAAEIFREGLRFAPQSERIKLGLARCFEAQGEHGKALVIVEDLARRPDAPPEAYLLLARLALAAGETTRAAQAYHRAVAADPGLTDPDLA